MHASPSLLLCTVGSWTEEGCLGAGWRLSASGSVVVRSLVHLRRALTRGSLGLECLALRFNYLDDAGKRGSVASLAYSRARALRAVPFLSYSASTMCYTCCSTQYVEVPNSTRDIWAQAAGDKGTSVSWSVWLLCGKPLNASAHASPE